MSFTDLCLWLKAHQFWVLAVILTTYVHFKAVSPTFVRFLDVIAKRLGVKNLIEPRDGWTVDEGYCSYFMELLTSSIRSPSNRK